MINGYPFTRCSPCFTQLFMQINLFECLFRLIQQELIIKSDLHNSSRHYWSILPYIYLCKKQAANFCALVPAAAPFCLVALAVNMLRIKSYPTPDVSVRITTDSTRGSSCTPYYPQTPPLLRPRLYP